MSGRSFLSQRPLVCFAALYGLGILLGSLWKGFVVALPVSGLGLGLLAAFLSKGQRIQRLLALALSFLALGALLGGLSNNPALPTPGKYRVSGKVAGEATLSEDGTRARVTLSKVELTNETGRVQKAGKAYWTFYHEEGAALPLDGQTASFEGRVYEPSSQVNPYGFDFKNYLAQKGIFIGITGNRELMLTPREQTAPESPVLRLRLFLEQRLDDIFAEESGLAKALLLGVREDLSEDTNRDFRKAGIAHVLAVSGLHVGFMVGALLLLLRVFHLSPRARLIILSLFLFMYCLLLGFSPSIVRASILAVMLLLGKAMKRRADPLTSLAAAFLLILLARPFDLYNLGFQLSFLAVFGIIVLHDALSFRLQRWKWFTRMPKWGRGLVLAYSVTFSASLMTLVPLVNAFHTFSLIGLLINPLFIALIGFLMAGFAIGLLLSFVSLPLSILFAVPVSTLSNLYKEAAGVFAGLPYATVKLPFIHFIPTISLYCALWLMSRYAMMNKRLRLALTGGLLGLGLLFTVLPRDREVSYTQLSSGFADSAVILDGGTTYVIDTGENGSDLAAFLLSKGRDVDHLLITHLHADHAGGLRQLIEGGLLIKRIYIPEGALTASDIDKEDRTLALAEQAGIPVSFLKKGDVLASLRVKGEVLWPQEGRVYKGLPANVSTLVTLWDLDGVSLLNASDLSASYAGYALVPAQILKASHHGSGNDNKEEQLRFVSPRLALITADETQRERYENTRGILETLGANTLVTGPSGAITLKVDKGQTSLETHLDRRD